MSIHFLWTRSGAIGSKIIRWGTDSESSHFAVGFDLVGDKGVIFHSHFQGLKIEWAKDYLHKVHVVKELTTIAPLQLHAEESIYQAVTKNYGSAYDWKGFAYFSWRVLLKKFFKRPIPKANKWGDKRAYLCTEVGEEIGLIVYELFNVPVPSTRGIITPDKLFEILVASPFLKRAEIIHI